MELSIEFWQLVSFGFGALVTVIGGFYTLVQVIVKQFKAHLAEKFKAQEEVRSLAQAEWNRRFETIERGMRESDDRYNALIKELPDKYQRREDAIRQEVAILSRLDGLAELVEDRWKSLDNKIEALRSEQ